MNAERPNEAEAKRAVEQVLGIELEHADKTGGVDYRSTDGRIAVEVTRITDGRKEAGRKALRKSHKTGTPKAQLQNCWLIFASDTQRGLKTFRQRVQPLIVELEAAGLESFDDQAAGLHVLEQRPLSHIYRPLLLAGVQRASAAPHHRGDPLHSHRAIVTVGGGGSASGSDAAVARLSKALGDKTDNPKKLKASGAEQRHLFVWLDDDTRFDIARPLSRDAPSWDDGGFGLPSSTPKLDPAVTHLWVVHEGSRLGWLWDGESWRKLEDL